MIDLLLICQKFGSDEIIFEGLEVIPDKAPCYNNIFPMWSHREQVVRLVVVCKGCSKHFVPGRRQCVLLEMMGVGRGDHLSSERSN